jgi:glycine oxidase
MQVPCLAEATAAGRGRMGESPTAVRHRPAASRRNIMQWAKFLSRGIQMELRGVNSSALRQVAVVGGGIVGCATAYQLARAGFKVTLIERKAIAAEASGRNAGNLNPLYGTPRTLIPFALEAFRIHEEIRSELMQLGCANYTPSPVKRILLGYDEAERSRLEETATLFRSTEGFSSTWLDRTELRRIEPRLARDVDFGVLIEGNLTVESHDLTRSLAAAAARLGATIRLVPVLGVVTSGEYVTGVETDEGMIACDEIVLATGPWIADTKSWLDIDVAVDPAKGEMLLMRLPGDAPRYDFSWGLTSLFKRRNNQVWVGGTMVYSGFDVTPTDAAKQSLLDRASQIVPDIMHAVLLDHIAALRTMTASHEPIAVRAPGWHNVYIANGGGSKGVLLSVGIARRIRDALLVSRTEPLAKISVE